MAAAETDRCAGRTPCTKGLNVDDGGRLAASGLAPQLNTEAHLLGALDTIGSLSGAEMCTSMHRCHRASIEFCIAILLGGYLARSVGEASRLGDARRAEFRRGGSRRATRMARVATRGLKSSTATIL